MVGRDNAHIPTESWPNFTWFMIEFAIVFAVANLIAFQLMPTIREMFTDKSLLLCEQVSHVIKCSLSEEALPDEGTLNWIYWGIVGGIFLGWYLIIRGGILKKPILGNRYKS